MKSDAQAKRDQLLANVRDVYTATTNAPYEIYSDSYLHEWLVNHGVVKTQAQKTRDEYVGHYRKEREGHANALLS